MQLRPAPSKPKRCYDKGFGLFEGRPGGSDLGAQGGRSLFLAPGAPQRRGGRLLRFPGSRSFRPGGGELRAGRLGRRRRLLAGELAMALHLVERGTELLPAQGTGRFRVEPIGCQSLPGREIEPLRRCRHRGFGRPEPPGRLARAAARGDDRLLEHLQNW